MAILKKQSLVDQIYDQIRYEIIELKMPLGGRLNVSELHRSAMVSAVRPFARRLTVFKRKGSWSMKIMWAPVSFSINEEDVLEIQELAMTLHTAAIKFAMKRGDHQAMAEEIRQEIEGYKSAKSYRERTLSVHNIVGTFYRSCGNSRLESNMSVIKGLQLILRNIYGRAANGEDSVSGSDNLEDFEKICAAVEADDTKKIIETLEQNEKMATPVILEAVREMNR